MSGGRSNKLVVFCGLDGSGKTTQLRMLAERLEHVGIEPLRTKQPTDDYRQLAEVRAFLSAGGDLHAARSLARLAAEDRRRHLAEVIEPALAAGRWVLCDRYLYSSIAYFRQRGIDRDTIVQLNGAVRRPDHAFLLDVPVPELVRRITARDGALANFEERDTRRLDAIRSHFLEERGLEILDGKQSAAALSRTIWQRVVPAPEIGSAR